MKAFHVLVAMLLNYIIPNVGGSIRLSCGVLSQYSVSHFTLWTVGLIAYKNTKIFVLEMASRLDSWLNFLDLILKDNIF